MSRVTWRGLGKDISKADARRLAARGLAKLNQTDLYTDAHRVVLDDGRRARLVQSYRTARWRVEPLPIHGPMTPERLAIHRRNDSDVADVATYDRAARYEAEVRRRTRAATPTEYRFRDWATVSSTAIVTSLRPRRSSEGRTRRVPASIAAHRRARWQALAEEWEVLQDAYLDAGALPEADFAGVQASLIFDGIARAASPRRQRW